MKILKFICAVIVTMAGNFAQSITPANCTQYVPAITAASQGPMNEACTRLVSHMNPRGIAYCADGIKGLPWELEKLWNPQYVGTPLSVVGRVLELCYNARAEATEKACPPALVTSLEAPYACIVRVYNKMSETDPVVQGQIRRAQSAAGSGK